VLVLSLHGAVRVFVGLASGSPTTHWPGLLCSMNASPNDAARDPRVARSARARGPGSNTRELLNIFVQGATPSSTIPSRRDESRAGANVGAGRAARVRVER
jgi:hypothetical protein